MFPSLKKRICDLVFPPACFLCERDELPATTSSTGPNSTRHRSDVLVCASCVSRIVDLDSSCCRRCSARVPIPSTFVDGCRICRERKWYFESIVTLGNYVGALRSAVLEMKKPGHDSVARHLGRLLAEQALANHPLSGELDMIAYTPGQWRRRLIPHPNVAESIAEGICDYLGIPILDRGLKFVRLTEKQGTLSRGQRFQNLKRSMTYSGGLEIRGKTLLLVDDVVTSGATANEATRAFKSAGAEKVFVAAVARGIGFS